MDVRKLVSQMTLEEKADMLSGLNMWYLKGVERLGIPSVMVTDGPHGLRKQAGTGDHLGLNESVVSICFPTAASLASTFDRELIGKVGEALGDECQAENVSVILGPGANIKRSPLCGRNFEYFSEDPYVAGEMAAAHINGVQSKNVGTSLKHYAVNNQETLRMTVDARVDERTLREIYLAGFETAVKKAQPWTVMGSYNKINGVYGCENEHTLTDILRNDWGFKGYVMTDWGALNDKIASIKAGLDLQMPGGNPVSDKQLVDAVNAGKLDEKYLDTACERILEITYRYLENRRENAVFEYEKHHELARKVESEACVLLKNAGVLPIAPGKKVALIGKFASEPVYQGGGSSHINSWKVDSAVEAFRDYDGKVVCAQGYNTDSEESVDALIAEAVEAARNADVALIFAGMPEGFESEGFDRKHLYLPKCQNELIDAVAAVNSNVVVILHNSSAVMMPWLDKVSAVIEAYLGGEAVGSAMFDVITGKVNPSGKLAETFPLRIEDTPAYLNFPGYNNVVEYKEGIYVGYRYYDARKMDVLFPFGHGLSYTTFEYSDLVIGKEAMKDDETVDVSFKVKNTGNVFGKEIVQLYVAHEGAEVARAPRELKGFEKVALEPGEEKTVTITLDKRSFAYFDAELNDWIVEDRKYGIEIGASSRDIRLTGEIAVAPAVPKYKYVSLNSTFRQLMAIPAGAQAVSGILAGMMPPAPPSEDGESKNPMGVDFMALMGDTPLRAMVNFSGGKFPVEKAQELVDAINAQIGK